MWIVTRESPIATVLPSRHAAMLPKRPSSAAGATHDLFDRIQRVFY
jgi:hypothetical protein